MGSYLYRGRREGAIASKATDLETLDIGIVPAIAPSLQVGQ